MKYSFSIKLLKSNLSYHRKRIKSLLRYKNVNKLLKTHLKEHLKMAKDLTGAIEKLKK